MPVYAERYKEFEVGDLITAYHKGFHVLEKIELRFVGKEDKKPADEKSPLFHYRHILTSGYKRPRIRSPILKRCDAVYCRKVDHKWICDQTDIHVKNMEVVRDVIYELGLGRQRKGK